MALHQLSSITIGVPNVSTATPFYDAFGLIPVTATANEARYATRDGGEQLRLTTAPIRALKEIVVGVDSVDDINRIAAALSKDSHEVRKANDELRVREVHAKVDVVVKVAPRYAPAAQTSPEVNRPGAITRHDRPADVVTTATPVTPSLLSHVVMGTPNYEATLAFFTSLIGFEISDQIPGIMSFTRCSEMHHNLAIQATPAPFLHHFAFEVDTVDDVLRGGSNMIEADAERHMWGLGRHAIGSNWFWYLKDPAGNFVEYTADLDRITAQDLYVPKEWAGKEYLYAYGPALPTQFLEPDDAKEIFAAQASD